MVGLPAHAFGGVVAVTATWPAVLLVVVAVGLWTGRASGRNLTDLVRARSVRPPDDVNPISPPRSLGADAVPSTGRRLTASVIAAIAAWALVGGLAGVAVGLVVAVGGPALLSRLETGASRRHREYLIADAPRVADLLAACLSAGTTMPAALSAVSTAMREPTAGWLRRVLAQLELGADPARVWESVAREPGLAAIGRAALRSDASGAPLAATLLLVAEELRREHRVRVEIAARSVGVRAVGPLGVCFLPAFLLLGVVPLVGSLVQGVLP